MKSLKCNLHRVAELGVGLTAIATLILAGCGGTSSSSTPSSATPLIVTPALGQIFGGQITVTGSNGVTKQYTVVSGVPTVTADIAGMTPPLLVALSGDPGNGNKLVFFDEGLGSISSAVVSSTDAAIRAIVPSVTGLSALGVGVTPLTEIAAATLANASGIVDISTLTVASAVGANTTGLSLAQNLSGSSAIDNVLTPPTPVKTLGANLAAGDSDLYAKVLHTLANLPASYGANAYQKLHKLRSNVVASNTLPAGFDADVVGANTAAANGYAGSAPVPSTANADFKAMMQIAANALPASANSAADHKALQLAMLALAFNTSSGETKIDPKTGAYASAVASAQNMALKVNAVATGTTASLALLETTDLHTNVLSYDYFKLAPDSSLGFERTATLIKKARAEFPNTMLLDNGDTIQGTALADYQALINPVACNTPLAIYKVMNMSGFEGGGIGNHEFNYGLPFLSQVTGNKFNVDALATPAKQQSCAGPKFPQVLANVYSVKSKQPLFRPYAIIPKLITATGPDGKEIRAIIKVGIIGFTPPTIMSWDKRWLDGKVYTVGIQEAAQQFIPEMKAKGADLIVAISHGGLDNATYSPTMENGNYHLAMVPGIDAMLIGHSHQVFPNATSTVAQFNLPGVDKVKGTVNGVPTVMANFWGKHLGVINLNLSFDGKTWVVDKTKTKVEARSIQNPDKSYVAAEASIQAVVQAEHDATIQYVKTPVGSTNFRMTSYFADIGDVSAIEIVNQAQADYVAKYVQTNLPQYASLPVLSVSAPFKSGFGGGNDFTDVAIGNIAINNAADLYLYPNTIYAVKVSGATVKDWLETSAKRFNLIDPAKTATQELLSAFPGYNFDMFTSKDMSYEIDVTQAVGSRIKNLMYKGVAISPSQEFIVATNNYRASGGGNFPGLDGSKTIFASPDSNRDVLIAYIKASKNLTLAANGADRSWRFAKVKTAGPVVIHSATNMLSLAQTVGLNNVSLVQADDGSGKNLSIYGVDLSK